ncbi:hypothetical protein D3870_05420 [Noviherbaspirillum cavernae]|uniref:Uncharacterized protein n=1 Tax=Noviherbaspirillum cavernae TaxID=2320862 RepID=A0A418WZ63_9BURK|nr:hypothetical protein D3870_05420 [Noviherbaspirillum cavernae]
MIAGLVVLLPRKIKLMKRIGTTDNTDILRLAKTGDSEALWLKRATWIFIVVGIIVLVPFRILSK